MVSGDARTHNCEPKSLVRALSDLGFEVLPRWQTSYSRAIAAAAVHISPPSFGNSAFWYAISKTPHRRLPAHHGRNGGSMQPLDCSHRH